jgi:diguanylate cyclase (GGDEF)-like protein/PAS domain S-box-containing protein
LASQPAKILVVDDVPENLSVVTKFLLASSYDVRPVMSSLDALRLAAADPPDLVLLDIRMPEMDGFEVCRHLKANEATAQVPVIFLSASGSLTDKLQAFQQGGVDYIEKPFQEEEVLARVRAQLRLRGVQQELQAARATLEQKVLERTLDLAAREAQYKRLVENSPSIIYTYSTLRGYVYANSQVERLLGHAPEALGRDPGLWHENIHPDDAPMVRRAWDSLPIGRGYDLEYRVRDAHGRWHWLQDRSINVRVLGREVIVDGISSDITEARRHRELMEHAAYHDPLTGLPNRKKLHEYMDSLMAADGEPFSLLLLDLDRFKEINDALGHHIGDQLLMLIAQRLREAINSRTGLVARLGGDEFAICVRGAALAEAETWAATVLAALMQSFELEGIRLEVGGSIGVAVAPRDGHSAAELLRCADVAMYVAKRTLSGYSMYSPTADSHSLSRLALVSEFGEALRRGELVLHYQPKLSLDCDRVLGVEALVRWQHPRHGLLMPGQFLPLIEVSDMVRKLTYWVAEAAAQQLKVWNQQGIHLEVAINLSARNLVDDFLAPRIHAALDAAGVPPDQLEVEITETAMMVDPDRAIATLRRIADLGVKLAVDDFGTGYSSFAFVRRMPPLAVLKIDRSFVSRMLDDPADAAVVESMVHLVHGLKVRAVAEGVEDQRTLDVLRRIGCHEVQGYHIAKPMDADRLAGWMRDFAGAVTV